MRIAMLGAKAVPAIGGIARYVEELGAGLASRGHDVTVYCRPHYLDGEATPYRGVHRVVTRGLQGKHLDALSHTATSALSALRAGFDILHVHGVGPGIVTPLLRCDRRSRTAVTLHSIDWRGRKWGRAAAAALRLSAGVVNRFSDVVACVSQVVQSEYAAATGVRAECVPTGVALAEPVEAHEIREWGLEAGGYIFCAARLTPEKGLHTLVEAFREVPTSKPLVVAGAAPEGDHYARELQRRAPDNVRFLGYVTGRPLAELYANAYLYVQPSELEGLSLSVLESLSYGRCVLASNIPANVEALGGCGRTFRTGDVGDLREKLQSLLEAPQIVAAEFEKARAYVASERSWDVAVDQYEALYERALSRSHRRRS